MSLLPSCKEAARLQSEALDKKLSLLQRIGLRLHLTMCKLCKRYSQQIRYLRAMAGESSQDESLPPSRCLSTEARARIQRKINSESV